MTVTETQKMIAQHIGSLAQAGYRRTKNPGHVWRTYRNYRDIGEPVPSWVLEAFDVMAASISNVLDTDGNSDLVLAALGFRSKGGGPGVVKQFLLEDRRLQAVYEILALQLVFGEEPPAEPHTLQDICDDVARRHHVGSEAVQNWYYDLTEKDPDRPGTRRLKLA